MIFLSEQSDLDFVSPSFLHELHVARDVSELARLLGPIISTSANPSGMKPADCMEEVLSYGLNIDAILDGGKTPGQMPSTIVDVTFSPPQLVREGVVPFSEILTFLESTY